MARVRYKPDDVKVLTAAWQLRTLTEVWSVDVGTWWVPPVSALSEALAAGRDNLRPAAEALGHERAMDGICLDETRADVDIAAQVARLSPGAAIGLVDAATAGWLECTLDSMFAAPCIDPVTELAPLSYLAMRVQELHAEALLVGRRAGDSQRLLIVRTGRVPHSIERETHMITIQVALRCAFRGGETLARIGPCTAAALVPSEPDRLSAALAVLSDELALAVREGRLLPTRVWLEPLPASADRLNVLLREINS